MVGSKAWMGVFAVTQRERESEKESEHIPHSLLDAVRLGALELAWDSITICVYAPSTKIMCAICACRPNARALVTRISRMSHKHTHPHTSAFHTHTHSLCLSACGTSNTHTDTLTQRQAARCTLRAVATLPPVIPHTHTYCALSSPSSPSSFVVVMPQKHRTTHNPRITHSRRACKQTNAEVQPCRRRTLSRSFNTTQRQAPAIPLPHRITATHSHSSQPTKPMSCFPYRIFRNSNFKRVIYVKTHTTIITKRITRMQRRQCTRRIIFNPHSQAMTANATS